eukprot:2964579-Pleurochrysis_carterae.AAC.1
MDVLLRERRRALPAWPEGQHIAARVAQPSEARQPPKQVPKRVPARAHPLQEWQNNGHGSL